MVTDITRRAVALCLLSYRDAGETNVEWETRVDRELKDWGLEGLAFRNDSLEAILAWKKGEVWTVIRGTDSATDHIKNMFGFARDAATLCGLQDYLALIKEQMSNGAQHFVTGHSRGGAVAYWAAEHLHLQSGIQTSGGITFGMPRPGNKDFAKAVNGCVAAHQRFVHCRDLVPRIPPPWRAKHVCQPLYITRSGDLIPRASHLTMYIDRTLQWWAKKPPIIQSMIGYHGMVEYADQLQDIGEDMEG